MMPAAGAPRASRDGTPRLLPRAPRRHCAQAVSQQAALKQQAADQEVLRASKVRPTRARLPAARHARHAAGRRRALAAYAVLCYAVLCYAAPSQASCTARAPTADQCEHFVRLAQRMLADAVYADVEKLRHQALPS